MSGYQGRGREFRGGGRGGGGFDRGGGGGGGFDRGGRGGRDFRGGRGGRGRGPIETSDVVVPLEIPFEPRPLIRPPRETVSLSETPVEDIPFPKRPAYCTAGRPIKLSCNHYSVEYNEGGKVYQYDFSLEGIEKMDFPSRRLTVIMKRLIDQNRPQLGDAQIAFDGRSIVYSSSPLLIEKEAMLQVIDRDLLEAKPPTAQGGRPPREPLKFMAKLMLTGERKLRDIKDFLEGRRKEYANDCINALDVVLRTVPSQRLTLAGRNFYTPSNSHPIAGGAEVWMGYYQSLRLAQVGMTFNADLAASAFMRSMPLLDYICEQLRLRSPYDLERLDAGKLRTMEKAIKNVSITINHRPTKRQFKIAAVTRDSASNLFIPKEDGSSGDSVAQYFAQKYNNLRYPNLPCVRIGPASKHMYLPLEVCDMAGGQRVMKLTEDQTAELIKVACRRPDVRRGLVHTQLEALLPQMNEHARVFGVNVKNKAISMTGRVLPPPAIRYSANSAKPVEQPMNGKWNMMNKKFFEAASLKCWAVVSFCSEREFPRQAVERFVVEFTRVAGDHGMQPIMDHPPIYLMHEWQKSPRDVMRDALMEASKQCGNQRPQFILCIKPGKEVHDYAQIKSASDTALGVPSQVMILKHAREAKIQVIANILLKVNAKIGGRNAVPDRTPSTIPTIVFGGDVHHPGPGSDRPSIAAVVASLDKHFARHAATVRVQEKRKDVIDELEPMVKELLMVFYQNTRTKPQNIIFLRDGISEGQFRQVLQYEVRAIESACRSLDADYRPLITFITCQKRHHTRLFAVDPSDQDNSGNVPAGTVVDTAICHPNEFDFYICSHSGIQGTSRPTKYSVLWDEINFDADQLQRMIFEMCFMQARCTRSVSIPPAVYYAHLVAFRAQHFVKDESDIESTISGRTEGQMINWGDKFDAIHADLKDVMYFI